MRLYDRLLSRQADGYNEYMWSGAYPVTAVDSLGRGREGAATAVVRAARDAYEANGIVFGCIAARMALFSQAQFSWQSMVDQHLFGTTDLALLEEPWPNATAAELLARMDQDVSTAGQPYIRRAEPADGGDALLVQMRPDCVTIISEEAEDRMGRVFRRPVGYMEDLRPLGIEREPQFYTTDEVAHWTPLPDPKASFRGMSWLTPILREVGADNTMTAYKTEHLANGAMPGLVIKYAQRLSDPTVATIAKRLTAKHSGPENAGKVWVLDSGADVATAGSTLEQLQFTAVQAAGETRVCVAAQVPAEVIGIDGPRSASGNYQLAIRRMADLWARPAWAGACAVLQHLLTFTNPATGDVGPVRRPNRLWYDVSGIAALREGELARAQAYLVKTQGLAASVQAGFTRESSVAAAESGDLSLLKADPQAPPPGVSGREAATAREQVGPGGVIEPGPGQRAPQAAIPQDLPGVVAPNLPDVLPAKFAPIPSLPNGARG